MTALSQEQLVRLSVVKIREAVKRGSDKPASVSTERIMVAFATCDRQRWIPESIAASSELWRSLDEVQRAAVLMYLGDEEENG